MASCQHDGAHSAAHSNTPLFIRSSCLRLWRKRWGTSKDRETMATLELVVEGWCTDACSTAGTPGNQRAAVLTQIRESCHLLTLLRNRQKYHSLPQIK